MADPKDISADEGTIVEKEELVEFLTSSGKIRRGIAESLHDQGMNTWELLVDGDEGYFTAFKGVGAKTAGELILLGEVKREELIKAPEPARDLREVLSDVPRITQGVIDALIEGGFDDVYKISEKEPSDLREVPGVGPKLSERVVEVCREEVEKHPQSDAGVEEAMPLPAEEAPAEKEEGFLSKLISRVKGFFSTEKEGAAEPPSEPEAPPEEEVAPETEDAEKEPLVDTVDGVEPEEKPIEEAPDDKPEEEPEAPDEDAPEAGKDREPAEDAPKEPSGDGADEAEPDDGPKKEEDAPEGTEGEGKEPTEGEEPDPEGPAEEVKPEEKIGLWGKIKGLFGGGAKPEEKEEERSEPDPKVEEPKEGEEEKPAPEGPAEEAEPKEDKASDEESVEGPEAEGKEEGEETSEEKPVEEGPKEEAPVEEKKEPSEAKPEKEEPRLEIKDIHHIPGVDKKIADLLLASGYMNLEELKEAVPEDLMMVEGIDEEMARYIYEVLRK